MHNDLVRHPGNVAVEIVGLAASAASIVAMAGKTIAIAPNAFLMVHNSWALTVGNSGDHQDTAALLNQIDGALAETYARRTGLEIKSVADLMRNETWLKGQAAVDQGFADTLLPSTSQEAQARFDLSVYAKVPAELTGLAKLAGASSQIEFARPELERILRQAGVSGAGAKRLMAGGWPTYAGVNHKIQELKGRLAAATAELGSVRKN